MNKILISSAVAVASVLGLVGVTGTVSAAPALAGTTTTQPPPCNVTGPVAGQGNDDFFPCIGPDGKAYPPKVPGTVSVNSLAPDCTTGTPKILYAISYANGRPATTVTIVIKRHADGVVLKTLTGQAFNGTIEFPGFSLNPPDFPGWDYKNGVWTPDPTEQALLALLDVEFVAEDGTTSGPSAKTNVTFPTVGSTPGSACAPEQSLAPPASVQIGALGPVCVGDVPYISYSVSGTGTTGTTATLTFFDLDGKQVAKYENQPLSGQVIFPGASVNPTDWPGWKFENGLWVTDPADARLRDGLTVRVDVTPATGFGVVSYPAESSGCASPTQVAAPLPATGPDIGGPLKMAGLAAATGVGLVLVARKRRAARTTAA